MRATTAALDRNATALHKSPPDGRWVDSMRSGTGE